MTRHAHLFGANLYFTMPKDGQERLLRSLLVDSQGAVAGTGLKECEVMDGRTARFRRLRKKLPAVFNDLLAQWRAGAISAIHASSRVTGEHDRSGQPTLTLALSNDGERRAKVHLSAAPELYDRHQTVAFLRQVASEFGCVYGCMCAGDALYVSSILSFMPSVRFGEHREDSVGGAASLLRNELFFYQRHRDQVGEWVPRAYWGNVLSPTHVAVLGGEARVRRECPCLRVEDWGRCLYLQLTESPWQVTVGQLLSLNDFLQPIRFPGSPDPVYREGTW